MTNQEDTYDYVGLTVAESRTIGEALAKLPFERVAGLLQKINDQVQAQFQQHQGRRAAERVPKRSTPTLLPGWEEKLAAAKPTNGAEAPPPQ